MGSEERHPPSLKWSAQFNVLPETATPALKGDKLILPSSALTEILAASTVLVQRDAQHSNPDFDPFNPHTFAAERYARVQSTEQQQQLPHPLTFRLVNPENGRILYAGIREFSAPEGSIGLSNFLRQALGIPSTAPWQPDKSVADAQINGNEHVDLDLPRLTVHAQHVEKGMFVKLRPLEAGYDVSDWRALLERHLRNDFTTLTRGEEITVPAGKELFRFLVDEMRPNHEAISLIDTDLEVDIEPLSEEQARETLAKLAAKSRKALPAANVTCVGGVLELGVGETGQVQPGEYVDYTLSKLSNSVLSVEVSSLQPETEVDVFVSFQSPRLRERPRLRFYTMADLSCETSKTLRIPLSLPQRQDADLLMISIGKVTVGKGDNNASRGAVPFRLVVVAFSDESSKANTTPDTSLPGPEDEQCSNCHQNVPKRTMFLHQNFCLRNNVMCSKCQHVFLKASQAWTDHWHCEHDNAHGDSSESLRKHNNLAHESQVCEACGFEAANTSDLSHHRQTICPSKSILCRFCHLEVAQKGPEDPDFNSAEVILSDLTPHEVTDGARTTECHLCTRIIRLRDMPAHLKNHDHERLRRRAPVICQNAICGRTVDQVNRNGTITLATDRHDMGLCNVCFGPLYVSQHDPDGRALRRRVERRYLTQLLTGCNQSWCRNDLCKVGRQHLGIGEAKSTKDRMQIIQPLLERIKDPTAVSHFCVDEASQLKRTLAIQLAAENPGSQQYDLAWCMAALNVEADDLHKARDWLKDFAPTQAESQSKA